MRRITPVLALAGLVLAASSPWAQQRPADRVVASVNGEEIRVSDIEQFVSTLPPQAQQIPRDELERLVVNELVNTRVIGAAARADGIEKDAEFTRRLKFVADRVVGELYLGKKVRERLTDALVKKRYDEIVKDMKSVEEVRASHIILATKEEAEKASNDAKRGGNFDEMAKSRSNARAGVPGGDLGYFQKEQMIPAIADAAFALEKNQISGPVQTQFGWHVIKVTDRRRQPPPKIDELRDQISEELSGEIVREIADEARQKAKVVMFGADGKPLSATP
jgi:peptidyl-prolyl cis-trans isomerase C